MNLIYNHLYLTSVININEISPEILRDQIKSMLLCYNLVRLQTNQNKLIPFSLNFGIPQCKQEDVYSVILNFTDTHLLGMMCLFS